MRYVLHNGLLLGVALVALSPDLANAQAAMSAREHYEQGLEFVTKGDVAAAAREFEAAYRVSPNAVVLYNLGQAYLELGDPVAALRAFEGYLRDMPRLKPEREREVQSSIALCKRRVGYLALTVEPTGSEITIDGQSLEGASLQTPIPLAVGRHGLVVRSGGHSPYIAAIDVQTGSEVSLDVRLESIVEVPTPKLGQLALYCAVPATVVQVDGAPVTVIANQALVVGTGQHRVSWTRAGYSTSTSVVEVGAGRVERVKCDLRPLTGAPPRELGALSLSPNVAGAQIEIDGRPSPTAARLPRGPHRVLVRHTGYLDWVRTVNVEAFFPKTVQVDLRPTPERAADLARSKSQRNWAYVAGGAGLALLGGSVALYAQNGRRYEQWEKERDALSAAAEGGSDASTQNRLGAALRDDAVSIQRRDDLALGAGVAAAGLIAYAVVSLAAAARHD